MIEIRRYGTKGPRVLVLHGGPGAPGYMAPVAREIADEFRVIEPLQRRSTDVPLTVAQHVADLNEVIESSGAERPALVGSSWGAMLALCYAAEHPESAGALVLIGCGTFSLDARRVMQETLRERMLKMFRKSAGQPSGEIADPDEKLRRQLEQLLPVYSYDPVNSDSEPEAFDARANEETWNDMVAQQGRGVYPARFAHIASPVLMLHGTYDPHPGRMILASLQPYIPDIEYREWEHCGHYPWTERAVRAEFFDVLRAWLKKHSREA